MFHLDSLGFLTELCFAVSHFKFLVHGFSVTLVFVECKLILEAGTIFCSAPPCKYQDIFSQQVFVNKDDVRVEIQKKKKPHVYLTQTSYT